MLGNLKRMTQGNNSSTDDSGLQSESGTSKNDVVRAVADKGRLEKIVTDTNERVSIMAQLLAGTEEHLMQMTQILYDATGDSYSRESVSDLLALVATQNAMIEFMFSHIKEVDESLRVKIFQGLRDNKWLQDATVLRKRIKEGEKLRQEFFYDSGFMPSENPDDNDNQQEG